MELLSICSRQIPVVAQKHARLRHLLKEDDFQRIASKDYSTESYRILSILIPALLPQNNSNGIPEWEWDGYVSRDAWERAKQGEDTYDEANDPSPTTAEMVAAFELALMVSGAGRLGKVLNLVQSGATLVGAQRMANSPALPGVSGASPSNNTGTPVPT
jgi:hypothetical protein